MGWLESNWPTVVGWLATTIGAVWYLSSKFTDLTGRLTTQGEAIAGLRKESHVVEGKVDKTNAEVSKLRDRVTTLEVTNHAEQTALERFRSTEWPEALRRMERIEHSLSQIPALEAKIDALNEYLRGVKK